MGLKMSSVWGVLFSGFSYCKNLATIEKKKKVDQAYWLHYIKIMLGTNGYHN